MNEEDSKKEGSGIAQSAYGARQKRPITRQKRPITKRNSAVGARSKDCRREEHRVEEEPCLFEVYSNAMNEEDARPCEV